MALVRRGKQRLSSLLKYDYDKFVENYERPFILGGGILGAVTPMVLSERRNTFNECVAYTTAGLMVGSIGGWMACAIHPFLLAGTVLGGPMWVAQHIRFRDAPPEKN